MKLTRRLMVRPGSKVKLKDWDADFTAGYKSKKQAETTVEKSTQRLAELQHRLYAEAKRSLLIVLQAMDAGGKDGTIRHVMSGVNPQGCRVTSFKGPSVEELSHDYLWRIHQAVPRKGEIGIFNRSHYEDVLIVRVHDLVPKSLWASRYDQINAFEKILSDNGVHILKFFLHISKDEQLRRFKERLEDPTKNWKADPSDFEERKYWDDYFRAYQDLMGLCSTPWAPWFIIPSNKKWFRNLAVSQIIVEHLQLMDMKFPEPKAEIRNFIVR
jgi:PPK2 family polyphosphate:nucleotide phosphotransferase